MIDTTQQEQDLGRFVRALHLLGTMFSEDERGAAEWDVEPGAWEGGILHPEEVVPLADSTGGRLPAFGVVGRALNIRPEVRLTVLTHLNFATKVHEDIVIECIRAWLTEDDPFHSIEVAPSDLAARMWAANVSDDPEHQLLFVLSQMDPEMRREFESFCGAVSAPFEIDDSYLESDLPYGQEND